MKLVIIYLEELEVSVPVSALFSMRPRLIMIIMTQQEVVN